MKPTTLINRYLKIKKTHFGEGNFFKNGLLAIDYLLAFIINGASFSDYFAYKFFDLKNAARKKYITYRKHKKIQKICNPDKKAIITCRDKRIFNNKFESFLGRKWLDVDKATFEQFFNFIEGCSSDVFIKGVEGFCGNDVWSEKKEKIDKKALFKELKEKGNYILEEKINQIGELSDFNPESVNTIRLTTIFDSKRNIVHIIKANIRLGIKGSSIDNLHAGSIAAHIDVDSGIIYKPGYDKLNQLHIFHPSSGKQIVGFKIPYWEECKDYIRKAAKLLPDVRYVGWDLVSKGDGSFCLIEANDNADHDIQQINDKGLWPEYKRILKTLK